MRDDESDDRARHRPRSELSCVFNFGRVERPGPKTHGNLLQVFFPVNRKFFGRYG